MHNFILSLMALSISSNLSYFSYLDNFNNYIREYNKHYNDSDYWYRYNIYETNMKHIIIRNTNLTSYKLGENNFTDMTREEFIHKYLNLKIETNQNVTSNYNLTNSSIPSSIDWRAEGLVTNVKDRTMW